MNKLLILLLIIIIIYIFNIFFNYKKFKGYNDLIKDYNKINYTNGDIPKIIIKTSFHKLNKFPPILNKILEDTIKINPEYKLYYFDNDDVDKFMKSYSLRAYKAYKKIIPSAFKIDLFRYCFLEKYGGCYSDIGHITYKSFDDICENSKLVIVKDLCDCGIHNALMCSNKNNPYFIKLVEECIKNIEMEYYGYGSLCITGPIFAGTVFYKYLMNDNNYKNENEEINIKMFNEYIKTGIKDDIKILELYIENVNETRLEDNLYIVDINYNKIIKNKFENYFDIMYNNYKRNYYNYYYNNKMVYKK